MVIVVGVVVCLMVVLEILDNNTVLTPAPVLTPGMPLVDSALVGTVVADIVVRALRNVVVSSAPPPPPG